MVLNCVPQTEQGVQRRHEFKKMLNTNSRAFRKSVLRFPEFDMA
jgi:hypothetical protein